MTRLRTIPICACFLLLVIATFGQRDNEKILLGKSYAKKQLMSVLSGKKQHNVVDNKTLLIKDSITAISVVEPLLFSIYGKENILQQRPYEVYFIDEYWIIWGTIPERWLDGTFLIILSATGGKILRITHGK